MVCTAVHMSSVHVLCSIDLLCKVWVGWLTICVCVFRQFVYYVIHQSREKLQGNKNTMVIISNFVQKSSCTFKFAISRRVSTNLDFVRLLLEISIFMYLLSEKASKLLNFFSRMKISHLFCLGMVARWANQGKPVRELQFEISSGEEWGKSEAVFYHQKKTGS